MAARPPTIQAGQTLDSVLTPRRRTVLIAALMLGMFLAALEMTIVGTAMPRVIADLNGLEHYAWVFTAYTLASTVVVPIYGKLSDMYGRKPFFIGGMAVFLLGSMLSGTSQDMTQLIIWRAIQGLGGGAMMPLIQAIIGDIFPPAERGKWQGLTMGMFGLATLIGPTAGGWITDSLGWRWVFFANLPVGLIALAVGVIAMPSMARRAQQAIDYLGAALLVLASVPLILAFSWAGTEYAWSSPQVIGLLVLSVVAGVGFFWVETRAPSPIISPSLFRNNIFVISVIASFLVSVGMFGASMFLPLFMQGVIGISATESGALQTPMMLGFFVSSIVGGQIVSRTGRYKIQAIVGFSLAVIGMFLLSRMDATTTSFDVIRNMIITGLGIGSSMSLFTIIVQNAFPQTKIGEVTASLTFFRQIGGTIGVAILGSILNARFTSSFQQNLPDTVRAVVPADRLGALQNPQVLLSAEAMQRMEQGFAAFPGGQVLFTQVMEAIRVSLASSIASLYTIAAIMLAAAVVILFFMEELPLRKSNRPVRDAQPTEGDRPAEAVATA